MTREKTYNFAAGPSMLPTSVLERASSEMLNYKGSGMSVMEMSHRSSLYQGIFDEAKADLRRLMSIPETHEILFLQGGASSQFSMVPLNLMGEGGTADYAISGNFSSIAAKEAQKYGRVSISADTSEAGYTKVPMQQDLKLDPAARYFYYCSNNTIYGTQWQYVPDAGNVPIVCDMSSNILSRPVDVSKFGIIFAGAQKNMAPAGLTVLIIDKALAGREIPMTPLMMSYKLMIDKDSMYNTPPCYNIYMLGLVLKWLDEQGGVSGIQRANEKKAKMLYDTIDASKLFFAPAKEGSRSDMNIVFRSGNDELDAKFAKEAAASGFVGVKGHRLAGGMRASLYNAVPLEAAERLCEFIVKFEKEN